MEHRYRKPANLRGKLLTIYVNGGDRRIEDWEILEGPQWEQFVSLGLLEPVAGSTEPVPAAARPSAADVTDEAGSSPATAESVTTSPAQAVAGALSSLTDEVKKPRRSR